MFRELLESLTIEQLEEKGWIIQSDIGLKSTDKVLEVAKINNLLVVTDETSKKGDVDIFIVCPDKALEMEKTYSGYFVWN